MKAMARSGAGKGAHSACGSRDFLFLTFLVIVYYVTKERFRSLFGMSSVLSGESKDLVVYKIHVCGCYGFCTPKDFKMCFQHSTMFQK